MRGNIKDIIAATGCNEVQANAIEARINELWLIDWSECSMRALNKAARDVSIELGFSK